MPTPEQIEVLRKEMETDLDAVRQLGAELGTVRENFTPQASQKDLTYVGYLLHGIYTAWEGAFRRIATLYENRLDPSQWHTHLLRRMSLDLPGIRPAVIDDETEKNLHKLRSFRHFFRHNYAMPLEHDELALVLRAYDSAAPKMEENLTRFLKSVEQIAQQAEEDQP